MQGYGVDPSSWSALPWSWAAERLTPNRNYWLVTASGQGRPHAMPVWGVWDDTEQRFMFSCSPTARKARNLRENDAVVVTVDDTVECISVEGVARLLDEGEEARERWVERYVEKYQSMAPELTAEFVRGGLIFEVRPLRAFGIIEREDAFSERATRWEFGPER